MHNIIILHGQYDSNEMASGDILSIMLGPKSMLKLCLEALYKQRSSFNQKVHMIFYLGMFMLSHV